MGTEKEKVVAAQVRRAEHRLKLRTARVAKKKPVKRTPKVFHCQIPLCRGNPCGYNAEFDIYACASCGTFYTRPEKK